MPKQKPAAREDELPAQPEANENQAEQPGEAVDPLVYSAGARERDPGAWFDDKPAPQMQPAPAILLRYRYQGRPSKGRVIVPGVYAKDDPALFGLAEYLLKNGHAEVVEET